MNTCRCSMATRRSSSKTASTWSPVTAGKRKLLNKPHSRTQKGQLRRQGSMTSENFDKALEGLKERLPFHPFTVELVGGHRFEVDHPGALVVRDGVAVFISPGGVPVLF